MDAPTKFCQPGFLKSQRPMSAAKPKRLDRFPGELCTTQGLPRRFARFGEHLSAMPLSRILNDQLTPGGTSTSAN